jgi:predicted transcriptional regulator
MRTTLDIDDRLLKQAKKLAAEEGKTLTFIIEEALRERLLPQTRIRKKFKIRLLTKTGRIIPGTNLADRDLLYERMEGRG